MKKALRIIGLISLTCFSFFATENIAFVVKDMDEIMVNIKQNYIKYKLDPIDAIVDADTIIPGVRGREVNINKSYKNMKTIGYYNDELYIYNYTNPNISLKDNIDKYIIKGNPSKRMVSLVFMVDSEDDLNSILNIVNNYKIKSTFFINSIYYSNNKELIEEMIQDGHNIGINEDYKNNSDYEWLDIVLKKVNKQKNIFCYNPNKDQENLEICKLDNNFTILPKIISDNTPLVDVKNNLESGSILSLNITSNLKRELSSIIIYIKSKGYTLTNLEENILE